MTRGIARGAATIVAGGALIGAAVCFAVPASASYRGANGVIVFSQGPGRIVMLTGGTEKVLTPVGKSQSSPAVSPDGQRIAFTMNYHLYIEKINGTGAKAVRVTGNPYEDSATWSANGTKLAYLNGSDGQIYTVAAAGGKPTKLTKNLNHAMNLRWSPDGTRIAFDANDAAVQRQVFTISVATHHLTQVTTDDTCASNQADWSPDSSELALSTACFQDGSNIGVVASTGGAPSAVARYDEADAGMPSWSPDGSTIVFSANEGMGSEQLWSSSPANAGDGTHVSATQLTSDSGQPYDTAPSWQPVHHARITPHPTSGKAGAAVSLAGQDFLNGQSVKLVFVAHNGRKTSLGTVQTAIGGSFTKTVHVPSGAAKGAGKFMATGVGGLQASAAFTVK